MIVAASGWSVHAPGKVLINQEISPEIRKIVFNPSLAPAGEYWCSTRLEFKPPITAGKVTFPLRGTASGTVTFKLLSDTGHDIYRPVKLYEEWSDVTLDFSDELSKVSSFELIFQGSWPAVTVEMGEPVFRVPTARSEQARFWMPKTVPSPVPGYRIETTIHSCWRSNDNEFPGINTPEGRAMALDITRKLKDEFGDLSVAVNFFGGVSLKDASEFVRAMNDMGVIVLSEGHDNPPPDEVIAQGRAAMNIHGEAYPDQYHNADKTNPANLEHLQRKLEFSAHAGAAVYRSVDYVWQHIGGAIWGYSDAAKSRWIEDLQGKDERIEILETDGSRRRADFREYFNSYFGYSMEPKDCGLTDWADFRPPNADEPDSPARRNKLRLFVALYHYEWVKFLNESVRPYDGMGMRAQPTLNPESQFNGTDLYWMLKSSLTRGWCTEWWHSAPVIVPVYYHAGYYGNVANKFQKEIIHLGETGAAGNGFGVIPNYWCNMANYLITYVKSAACDAKVMNDQYWAATYQRMTAPGDSMPYEMYTGFRSAWSGFLQSKNDHAVKPASGVLVIQNRAVMDNITPFDVGAGTAPRSIARDLIEQNFTYDGGAFPISDAYDLANYRVIVHTPNETPRGFGKQLRQWLSAAPGRTLITHSDIVNREAGPVTSLTDDDAVFRAGKGLEGLPVLRPGNVSSGVLKVSDPELRKILAPWAGKTVKFPAPLADAPGGTVLATVGDAPLLSEFSVGGSRIVYLHNTPITGGAEGRKLQKALVAAAMRRAGITPAAFAPEERRVLVFNRNNSSGRVVFIIDIEAEPKMERDGKIYRVYQALNPAASGSIRLAGSVPGKTYRCTDMITGDSFDAAADSDGLLELPFDGWNLRGLYVDPLNQ